MKEYSKTFEVRWADYDMNRHMRHTAYGDYCAHMRLAFFSEKGLTAAMWNDMGIGPALLHEDLRYLREIGPDETIRVTAKLSGLSRDGMMWRFLHEIFRKDGKLAATITAAGVWIDLKARRKTAPPKQVQDIVDALPKSDDFEILTNIRAL